MMTSLLCNVIRALGTKTLVTAESCTGGGIGAAITSIPGSSSVYKGGIISYTNEVKVNLLGVKQETLDQFGAVSEPVASQMAAGACRVLSADYAISVTGLAGPGGDDFGNEVGTVFIGFSHSDITFSREFHFTGDRESVRMQTVKAALQLLLDQLNQEVFK